jgi:hypothetical protein
MHRGGNMEGLTQLAKAWIRQNLPSIEPVPACSANDEPAAWKEDFLRWMLFKCCFTDRCFGGVSCLHRDFCEWQVSRNEVPPSRAIFDALLQEEGVLVVDGLTYGLLLREEREKREERYIDP